MIRIDLVDNTATVKHVDFRRIPVTKEADYRCIPDGILPLQSVMELSKHIKAGRVSGQRGKFVWYRLIDKPVDAHKDPLGHCG